MGFNYHGITTDMTKQLCHFVKELKYEDIPPMVIERAKMNIMHTVGVSLCGAELQQVQDAIAISQEMSVSGGHPVGHRQKDELGSRRLYRRFHGRYAGLGGLLRHRAPLRRRHPHRRHRR